MADSGGSKTQTVQTTSNSAPWGPTQPGLTKGVEDLGKLYDSGSFNIPRYPGQTLADVAPETSDAWKMVTDITKNPNASSVQAATNYNNAILKGDYSALSPMFDAAKDAAGSTYEAAGRYGSGYHDNAVSKGVGSVIANAASTAAAQAPGLQTAMYAPAAALSGVGAERSGRAQDEINQAIGDFNYDQTAPINAVNAYMQALSGNWGGTTVGTQPIQKQGSSWQDYLGAALGVGSLGVGAYGAGVFG
jgi:hypothetical protein